MQRLGRWQLEQLLRQAPLVRQHQLRWPQVAAMARFGSTPQARSIIAKVISTMGRQKKANTWQRLMLKPKASMVSMERLAENNPALTGLSPAPAWQPNLSSARSRGLFCVWRSRNIVHSYGALIC